MPKIAISIEDVAILANAYPDKVEWQRVSHDGTYLETPDDLDPPISVVDMGEARKADLLQHARLRRWQKETGGIMVGGVPIATDDRSKQMITGARMSADADPEFETSWDAGAVDVTLSASQIIAISDAVRNHVKSVFETFKSVRAGIDSGTIETRDAIDAAFAA